MQVINSLKSRIVRLPVQSATDLVAGSLMIKGTTYTGGANTDVGTVIVGAATSASDYVGILAELHDYSVNGSALVGGAEHSAVISGAAGAAWFAPRGGNPEIFPAKQIELIEGMTLCKVPYALTGVAVTSASSTVTVNMTSGEQGIDTGFLYGSSGGALGELRWIVSTNTNVWTTSVAFTTTEGNVVKILPLLHGLARLTVGNTTTETKIDSTAAAGAARFVQLERHILVDGDDAMMDPYTHRNMSGLNSKSQLAFYGVFGLCSTVFSPLS